MAASNIVIKVEDYEEGEEKTETAEPSKFAPPPLDLRVHFGRWIIWVPVMHIIYVVQGKRYFTVEYKPWSTICVYLKWDV